MKFELLLFLGLIFGSFFNMQGQTTGVRSVYDKETKGTKVETNFLYVINSAENFEELQLDCWYKGDKLSNPPPKIEITLLSFSKKPLFKNDKDRVVTFMADDEEIKPGTLSISTFKGETKNGIDTFFVDGGNPNLGMQIAVPQTALIKSSGKVDGLTMEMMILSIKTEQFMKMIKSSRFDIKIGGKPLSLSSRQIEVMNNFADQITPK